MESWILELLNFLFRGLIVQGVASLGLWFFWTWEVHLDMHQAKTSTLIVQGKTSKLGHYQGNLPTLAGINFGILIEYFPLLWRGRVHPSWSMILRHVDILSARREYHVTTSLFPTLSRLKSLFYYWVLTKVHPYVVNSLIVWLAKWKYLIFILKEYIPLKERKSHEMKIEIIGGAVPSRAKWR